MNINRIPVTLLSAGDVIVSEDPESEGETSMVINVSIHPNNRGVMVVTFDTIGIDHSSNVACLADSYVLISHGPSTRTCEHGNTVAGSGFPLGCYFCEYDAAENE